MVSGQAGSCDLTMRPDPRGSLWDSQTVPVFVPAKKRLHQQRSCQNVTLLELRGVGVAGGPQEMFIPERFIR